MKFAPAIAVSALTVAIGTLGLALGSGEASAGVYTIDKSRFSHVQSLTDGTLTVSVTNGTTIPMGCAISIYKAGDLAAVQELADASNAYYEGTGPLSDITAARAKLSAPQLKDLQNDSPIAAGKKYTGTWTSNRADSSYAVFQNCVATDQAGTNIAAAQGYAVTGGGKSTGGIGTGSLGNLFG